MFINYAHRGASEYRPENTMSSFQLGIKMGANGIETDIRRSRDGFLVLFHDDTLKRVTGESGSVSDYTYAELSKFNVYDKSGKYTDKIVLFEDFLKAFSPTKLYFAIELKEKNCEEEVLDLLEKYNMREKCTITSFCFEYIKNIKKLDCRYKTGFLCDAPDEEKISDMKSIACEEVCPKADLINKENVALWHGYGFNVRAWGVADTNLMERIYDLGVDGMTVNFPDRLEEYKKQR